MAKITCFSALIGRKNRVEKDVKTLRAVGEKKGLNTLQVKTEQPLKIFKIDELNSVYMSEVVPFGTQENGSCNVKLMSNENLIGGEAAEVAYEGGDEHEENSSIKRGFFDFDLQARDANLGEEKWLSGNEKVDFSDSVDCKMKKCFQNMMQKDAEKGVVDIQTGHVSDPGVEETELWVLPELKRSCSSVETRDVLKSIVAQLPISKSQSFEELQKLAERSYVNPDSPGSILTNCSADKVMLKNHSSIQVLPSRSRRLWWKLFLWSHRNLHKPLAVNPLALPITAPLNQQGGYSSDTLVPNRAMESPGSCTEESMSKGADNNKIESRNWDAFHNGISGSWLQNQWVALAAEPSSFSRVDEWIKELDTQPPVDVDNEKENIYSESPARSAANLTRHPDNNLSDEILHANSVIRTLNASSTVAHISGVGLKVIPTIGHLSRLRSVNLSGNSIVHITPGSLPKGLHMLNLSRNKINTIQGLRELTGLRVLDLSYNRISRIGQGLSNCRLIKELYLAGNIISDVEGLHRLLKLTILDLSFNKITTKKGLGQLVANYNSLLALSLIGNPIQRNMSDDQLKKAVSGLLPKLSYVNKQSIKSHRAREVVVDSVAKAALGNNSWGTRKKTVKITSQGVSTFTSRHRSRASIEQKRTTTSKSHPHRPHQRFPTRIAPSALASASQ